MVTFFSNRNHFDIYSLGYCSVWLMTSSNLSDFFTANRIADNRQFGRVRLWGSLGCALIVPSQLWLMGDHAAGSVLWLSVCVGFLAVNLGLMLSFESLIDPPRDRCELEIATINGTSPAPPTSTSCSAGRAKARSSSVQLDCIRSMRLPTGTPPGKALRNCSIDLGSTLFMRRSSKQSDPTTPGGTSIALIDMKRAVRFDYREEDKYRNIRRCSAAPLGDSHLIKRFELDNPSTCAKEDMHFKYVCKIEPITNNSFTVETSTVNKSLPVIAGNQQAAPAGAQQQHQQQQPQQQQQCTTVDLDEIRATLSRNATAVIGSNYKPFPLQYEATSRQINDQDAAERHQQQTSARPRPFLPNGCLKYARYAIRQCLVGRIAGGMRRFLFLIVIYGFLTEKLVKTTMDTTAGATLMVGGRYIIIGSTSLDWSDQQGGPLLLLSSLTTISYLSGALVYYISYQLTASHQTKLSLAMYFTGLKCLASILFVSFGHDNIDGGGVFSQIVDSIMQSVSSAWFNCTLVGISIGFADEACKQYQQQHKAMKQLMDEQQKFIVRLVIRSSVFGFVHFAYNFIGFVLGSIIDLSKWNDSRKSHISMMALLGFVALLAGSINLIPIRNLNPDTTGRDDNDRQNSPTNNHMQIKLIK